MEDNDETVEIFNDVRTDNKEPVREYSKEEKIDIFRKVISEVKNDLDTLEEKVRNKKLFNPREDILAIEKAFKKSISSTKGMSMRKFTKIINDALKLQNTFREFFPESDLIRGERVFMTCKDYICRMYPAFYSYIMRFNLIDWENINNKLTEGSPFDELEEGIYWALCLTFDQIDPLEEDLYVYTGSSEKFTETNLDIFLLTSISKDIAKNLYISNADPGYLIRIRVKAGTRVLPLSVDCGPVIDEDEEEENSKKKRDLEKKKIFRLAEHGNNKEILLEPGVLKNIFYDRERNIYYCDYEKTERLREPVKPLDVVTLYTLLIYPTDKKLNKKRNKENALTRFLYPEDKRLINEKEIMNYLAWYNSTVQLGGILKVSYREFVDFLLLERNGLRYINRSNELNSEIYLNEMKIIAFDDFNLPSKNLIVSEDAYYDKERNLIVDIGKMPYTLWERVVGKGDWYIYKIIRKYLRTPHASRADTWVLQEFVKVHVHWYNFMSLFINFLDEYFYSTKVENVIEYGRHGKILFSYTQKGNYITFNIISDDKTDTIRFKSGGWGINP